MDQLQYAQENHYTIEDYKDIQQMHPYREVLGRQGLERQS